MLEFLKARKDKKLAPPISTTPINDAKDVGGVNSDAATKLPSVNIGGWLNMGRIERDKMEWMTDVPVTKDTVPQVTYLDVRHYYTFCANIFTVYVASELEKSNRPGICLATFVVQTM